MLKTARAGKALSVVNDQVGAPTYTMDLAEAVADLPVHHASGICHVTNAGETTWFDFTAAILEEFSLTAPLSAISSADWKRQRPHSASRPGYSVLDISAVEKLRGKQMPHWRDALHRYRLAAW